MNEQLATAAPPSGGFCSLEQYARATSATPGEVQAAIDAGRLIAVRLGRQVRIPEWQIRHWPDLPAASRAVEAPVDIARELVRLLDLCESESKILVAALDGLTADKQQSRARSMFVAGMQSPLARIQILGALREGVFTRDGRRCQYCGKHLRRGTLTIDHVTPASWGGTHGEENLVTACRSCNSAKGAKIATKAACGHLVFDWCRWKECRQGRRPA